jgi:hypothetical protein
MDKVCAALEGSKGEIFRPSVKINQLKQNGLSWPGEDGRKSR